MPKFRKKPVEIEAIQWTGANVEECMKFCPPLLMETYRANGTLTIPTLEGKMIASTGDWIIKEPFPTGDRQFYPCKPDIFAATYEPVESERFASQMQMIDGFPRRNRIDHYTPAELAIRAAMQAVEEAGAHELLTDAVELLQAAQNKVADFAELPPVVAGIR